MNEPERTEWQIRCAFNGFCKRILKNESINAHKEIRKRQAHEINFSDLTPKEENPNFLFNILVINYLKEKIDLYEKNIFCIDDTYCYSI